MLQVTGHAGGVPKATLERGRSVEFPSEGNVSLSIRFFSILILILICVDISLGLFRFGSNLSLNAISTPLRLFN